VKPNECVQAQVDLTAQKRARAAIRGSGRESTDQEFAGGACSKMLAARNGDPTQCEVSAGVCENFTSVAATIENGAAAV
jgi:hypothetical protein